MPTVRQIASSVVAREGGYVNDPDDPGGATKFGVTIGTMRRLGLDLTGDGKVTEADVKKLTRERAVDIFVRHYFEKPGIGRLPEPVQASVFDMYVNAGGNAVRILQGLLAAFGRPASVDGALGPQTAGAAAEVARIAPDHFADAYAIARRNYYYRLGDRRPASRKYCRRRSGGKGGWIVRAEEFMAGKYHLSDADHARRCAKWD